MKMDLFGREFVLLFLSQVTKTAQLLFDAVIIWLARDAVNRLPATTPG